MTEVPPVLHPVQLPKRHGTVGLVPAPLTEAAFEVYAALHADPPTLEQLNARGGHAIEEVIACLYAARFPREQWRDRAEAALDLFALAGFRP